MSRLSEREQDEIAEVLLADLETSRIEDEIASGKRPLPHRIADMAAQARQDIQAGKGRPIEDLLG